MSKTEKTTYLNVKRCCYADLKTKKDKGILLDEVCSVTGLDRKHVIKQLNKEPGASRRRGRRRTYDMNGCDLLVEIWKLSDCLCGKLLHAVAPMWLESLEKTKTLDPDAKRQVLRMSASTMDRLLRGTKHQAGGSRRRQSASMNEHRAQIPLKIDVWPKDNPREAGWLEADTVAHCGGSMSGSFAWTLTVTDTGSHWTEMRCVWNKGAEGIVGRITQIRDTMPFDIKAFNTDNGPEFLNDHLRRHFPELCPDALRSRSRPYIKNDNAHVEQKNGDRVRPLFGYGRIDECELVDVVNETATLRLLFDNLFTPTMRLISKQRIGAKYVKVFEKQPKTPAQRILEARLANTPRRTRK